MKNKLKNNATDILLFVGYHLIVGTGIVLLLAYLTEGNQKFEFKILEHLNLKKITSSKAKLDSKNLLLKEARIESIKGKVIIFDSQSTTPIEATAGDVLREGMTIETHDKSSAVILFGDKYSCRVRIGARTIISLDTLMKKTLENKSESTFMNLIKGGVYFLLQNDSKAADLKVKALSAVFAVRGTNFAVVSDGVLKSMLTVSEGEVGIENVRSLRRHTILAGTSYISDMDGNEKILASPEIINKFDFEGSGEEVTYPESNEVFSMMGALDKVTSSDKIRIDTKNDLTENISLDIAAFKKENELLANDIDSEKTELENLQDKLKVETPKINEDIYCIENSSSPCGLYSEKLLTTRGFPRTFGDPRLRRSLVQDLRLYLNEQQSDIAEKKRLIKNSEELFAKRASVLKWAEKSLSDGTELELIIPKLREKHLER